MFSRSLFVFAAQHSPFPYCEQFARALRFHYASA